MNDSLPFCSSSSTSSFNPFNFRENFELTTGQSNAFGNKLNTFNNQMCNGLSNGGNLHTTTNNNGHQSSSLSGFVNGTIGTSSSTNHNSSWPSLVTTNGIGNNNNHIHQNNDHHHNNNNNDYYYNQLQSNFLKCSTYDETASQMKSYSSVFKY